ncbi:MAG: UvrD-helicase domain-containing protein [Patescibacteria group bacterium]
MNNLLEKLNPEQLKAVTHRAGPLLIVAGAGTGKTTVITQRIAYIIEQNWAKSDEILALTFTEKAAGEMEERVDRLLPMGYLDLWISTFHSFGERILKEHGLAIGLPADFKLLNEFEQYALIKKNLAKFELDYYRPLGNPTKFIRELLKHFSRAKDENISPAEYLAYAEELKENLDDMLTGAKGKKGRNFQFSISNFQNEDKKINQEIFKQEVLRINEVANAYHVYQQLLLDNNGLDFGDLINYSIKLFQERPGILAEYQKKFKYILLDEFQDTNWAQYELIKMLAKPNNNIVVVGDDDQAIYKFRGASVANIMQFKKDFSKSEEIVLIKNYRNKQNILDLSYEFIKQNNPNRLEHQLNMGKKAQEGKEGKKGLNKKLVAEEKGKGAIEVITGTDLPDEVKQVVEKIADLKIKDKEASWNDFAILVRANDSAKNFCNTLEIAGLPYQFLSSRGLYAKSEIIDIISYLKLLDNYHESSAMYRILNLPVWQFSYQEIVNFNYWAKKKAWSLYEVLKSVSALNFNNELQEKVRRVLNLIEKHTSLARDKSTSEVVLAFLDDSQYLKNLVSQTEQKSYQAANFLNKFLKRIKEFEAGSDDKSIKAFLKELEMEIDAGEEGSLPFDIEAGPEAIKIMTVHGAKGLEFKYVFIASLVDKRFPTIERKEKILIPEALIKEILPVGDIHLEEERRLFYVAMTRAKAHLYFTWAPDYGGVREKKPSRFLVECNLLKKTVPLIKKKKTDKIEFQNILTSKSETEEKGNINNFIPHYLSYTQLAAFSNCPYQYRFAHILKIPGQGKPQFSFGKTLHLTMQKLFELINEKKGLGQSDLFNKKTTETKNPKISLEEILKIFENSWLDDWYDSKAQKEEYRKKGKEIIKGFYEKYKDEWPETKFLEKGFNFKVVADDEPYTIRGVIDRIDLRDGKLKIVDYKTGQAKEKLIFEEKEQLLLYQLALENIFSEEIGSLSFYYLNNNSEVEFLGSQEELNKMKEKIVLTIKEIKLGDFSPRPSQLCKYCDFFNICEFRKAS